MRAFLIMTGVLLMCLRGASGATSAGAVDPNVVGIWVPDYHGKSDYISQSEMDIFADGSTVIRTYGITTDPVTALYVPVKNDGPRPYLKWIINGSILTPKDVEPGTASFGNGQFSTTSSGETDTGTYQLSTDHRIMTLTQAKIQVFMKKVADITGKLILKPKPAAAPVTSGGVDSQLAGLWVERVPMPDKGYTLGTIFEIHPDGTFVAHMQHIAQGQNLTVGDNTADVETDTAKIQAVNGRYTVTSPDGTSGSASYVIDHAKTKMIVIYDSDSYGYLFVRMGDVGADGSLSVHNGFSDLEAMHVVDPKLVRVWIGGIQNADSIMYKMIEWHPNGDFVMHVRTVTGSQSVMDVKDSETYPGQYDAFNGRFLLNEPNDLRESGVYSFKYGTPNGTELDLTWDTNKTSTDTYRVFGDFDSNGAIRPLPAAK